MNTLPLVSIVIPTFNQGDYLPVCIDHCLFQTYPKLELIIVDGGSTDATKEYLSGLAQKIETTTVNPVVEMSSSGEIVRQIKVAYPQNRQIKILTFDHDIGATRTYNEGFKLAQGIYCTYIVGDDIPHSHMIEYLVKAIEQSGADFVYSDMNIVDDQGHMIRQMRLPDYDFFECFAKWYHLGVSHLYRRKWHDIAGYMDEENYRSANDYDHYLRFAMNGAKFYHISDILYSIRYHSSERKTGQHTDKNYENLLEESKRCALRARAWLDQKKVVKNNNIPSRYTEEPVRAKKKVLITGITGQDGSYLAEYLLEKDYEVYGLVRRVSFEDESRKLYRIKHILDRVELIPGSMESFPSIYKAIHNIQPDEVYHLAAVSYVGPSFDDEISTINVNINGIHHILAACKDLAPECKIFFPGSSEMFGQPDSYPQNESTPFNPRSAYGISKLAGYHLIRNYRDKYHIYACSGILFNHESPRRGFEFVSRKITSTAAKIKLGVAEKLKLGNLHAKRDWGHADEYIHVIWKMLQQENADDFVISTGKTHTVEQFCELAFTHLGLNYQDYVEVEPRFYREECGVLVGDSAKAYKVLGWEPKKSFVNLVHEMVDSDLKHLSSS